MDYLSELLKLVPEGPWKIGFAIAVAGISGFPAIARTWTDHRSHRKHFDRVRRNLELLKLRYEIALLQDHASLSKDVVETELLSSIASPSTPASSERRRLRLHERLIWAACGGLLLFLIISFLAAVDSEDDIRSVQDLIGWVVGGLLLALPTSLLAALSKKAGKFRLTILGFLCSFLLTMGMGLIAAMLS